MIESYNKRVSLFLLQIWMYFIIYNLFFDTCRLCIETFIFIFVI